MRRIAAIILLLVFMFHAATKIAYTAWHYINQDKIAALYCINKDKVEIDCKGCCHLVLKLNQMDAGKKSTDTTPPGTVAESQIDWYLEKNAAELQLFYKTIFNSYPSSISSIVWSDITIPNPPPEV